MSGYCIPLTCHIVSWFHSDFTPTAKRAFASDAMIVRNRLLTAERVDDREPHVADADGAIGRNPDAVAVRATVPHGLQPAADFRLGDAAGRIVNGEDAAHISVSPGLAPGLSVSP